MDDHKVTIRKVLPANIEKVFNAWVNPLQMQHWYSPEGMTTSSVTTDLRMGGSYSITMNYSNETPPRSVTVKGVYKEIQKPTKLCFSWQWEGQADVTEVTILLRELSEKQTELTLIHAGFEDKQYNKGFTKADHIGGWNSAIHKLELLLNEGNRL